MAVYDNELEYAKPELAALLTHLAEVQPVTFAEDLVTVMTALNTQPDSLLAMAVHGSADGGGWGQAKKIPKP